MSTNREAERKRDAKEFSPKCPICDGTEVDPKDEYGLRVCWGCFGSGVLEPSLLCEGIEKIRSGAVVAEPAADCGADGITLIAAIASDCSYKTFRGLLESEHHGDCTGAPQTCMRCLAEKRIEVARKSLSQWAER